MRQTASVVLLGGMLLAGTSVGAAPSSSPPAPTVSAAAPSGSAPEAIPTGAQGDLVTPTGSASSFFPEAPPEAPPPLPRHKGLVLESRLGAMAYLGKFGSLAPPGPWVQTQLGYEFFKWLMLYGYGEITYTGTSNGTGQATTLYFPIYGFGGGLRFTVHVTPRVALFLQGNAGAISSIVGRGDLTFLGFEAAESLGFTAGGRLGVEWYQIDRHMALSLGVGLRDAFNFKIQDGESDVPLMLDAGVAIRYTF